MSEIKRFKYKSEFELESGEILPGFELAYQTFGKINADGSNVIWIIHALTANSDPTEWWPGIVGEGKVINPKKHFIICANALGSHYGSTNPLHVNPLTGRKYHHSFPALTNRDIVHAFVELRKHLGIEKIRAIIGASIGGQQALEWAIIEPKILDNLVLLATNAKHSPYGIAFNESQRLAIEADQTWQQSRDDAGQTGLLAARSIALLSYRTSAGYNRTQQETEAKKDNFKAASYQRYQGQKLVNRFNAFSYWVLSKAMDSHDVGRLRGGIDRALSRIKATTTVIGINSDFLFPVSEQIRIASGINKVSYVEITSDLGHDGFLTENKQVSKIISKALRGHTETQYLKVS